MEMTTVRVDEPRELLALLPFRLGFHPVHSAVVVSLRPPRGEVGLVARVDLADLADPEEGPRLALGLVGHLGRDGAGRAVLVVYCPADPRVHPSAVVDAAVARVRDAAEGALGVLPCWAVTTTGYLCLDCDGPCCPPGGRPLRELESTQVGAQMVLAGTAVLPGREALGAVPAADGDARRAVARVHARWASRRAWAEADGPAAVAAWRQRSVAAWRSLLRAAAEGRAAADRPSLGRVSCALEDGAVRDAVLVSFLPDAGDLPERSVVAAPGDAGVDSGIGSAVAALVDPGRARRPPADVRDAVDALEAVVAHARRGSAAPALTLLALLAWWQGEGARATVLVRRATDEDPSYRLAQLVDEVLAAGLPPGWARAAAGPGARRGDGGRRWRRDDLR